MQISLLRTCYARWNETRGESIADWQAILAPDFTLQSPGDGRPGLEFAKDCQGAEELALYFQDLSREWQMEYYRIDDFVGDGTKVVAIGVCGWTHRRTGKRVDTRKIDVWTFRDGKATELYEMFDTEAVIAAAS
ncbi:MAG: nuclear transport factor 2 family protein [Pseudomonadota bacterium]